MELAHHQRDLAAMIRGVVRQMLHQLRQTELCPANRKHSPQGFLCHGINEFRLFFLDFHPLLVHRRKVGKRVGAEKDIVTIPQVRQQYSAGEPFVPIRNPTPLAPNDVHQGVAHGMKAAPEITGKPLTAQRGNRLQNRVVRPAVVFEEELNIVLSHLALPMVSEIIPGRRYRLKSDMGSLLAPCVTGRLTAYSEACSGLMSQIASRVEKAQVALVFRWLTDEAFASSSGGRHVLAFSDLVGSQPQTFSSNYPPRYGVRFISL